MLRCFGSGLWLWLWCSCLPPWPLGLLLHPRPSQLPTRYALSPVATNPLPGLPSLPLPSPSLPFSSQTGTTIHTVPFLISCSSPSPSNHPVQLVSQALITHPSSRAWPREAARLPGIRLAINYDNCFVVLDGEPLSSRLYRALSQDTS